MNDVLNPRLAAFHTLNAVFENRKPLDQSLEKFAIKYELDARDRGFAHSLCGMVLRHKQGLQNHINRAANRKRDVGPIPLNTILLMGLAQLWLMHVPDHAAIDTSVTLAETCGLKKQKGLVNAILRQLQASEKPLVKPSIPKWLFEIWALDYDVKTAKDIADASLREAALSLTNKATGENKPFIGTQAVASIEGYDSGDWWVQDFASHLPVTLLGDIAGKTVFDLCAAPGGKTMQLAAKGAQVTAVDLSDKRLVRMDENLTRTNLSEHVQAVCADLLKWTPDTQADIVILDAPCSATGTIRRHPDLPFNRTLKDLKTLAALQYDLLNRSKKWVKVGGTFVYCTCSIQKNEGESQINRFLEQNKNFKRHTIADYKNWQTTDGDIRLLPSYGNMDGFFISVLEKTA